MVESFGQLCTSSRRDWLALTRSSRAFFLAQRRGLARIGKRFHCCSWVFHKTWKELVHACSRVERELEPFIASRSPQMRFEAPYRSLTGLQNSIEQLPKRPVWTYSWSCMTGMFDFSGAALGREQRSTRRVVGGGRACGKLVGRE